MDEIDLLNDLKKRKNSDKWVKQITIIIISLKILKFNNNKKHIVKNYRANELRF